MENAFFVNHCRQLGHLQSELNPLWSLHANLSVYPLWITFSNFKCLCFWLTFSWDICGQEARMEMFKLLSLERKVDTCGRCLEEKKRAVADLEDRPGPPYFW